MIPKDWEEYCFKDVAKIANGQVDPRQEPYSGYLHIGPENIESGTGKARNLQITKDLNLVSGKYLFDERAIVYSKIRPNLNKVCIPNFIGICSADMYPIWANEDTVDRFYLFHFMTSEFFLKFATAASSRTGLPKINRQELDSIKILCPPLLEQCKIAEVLGVWDESIDLLERLIGKTRSRKQGLMQQLLTGKKRFKEFEGSEWKTVKLENLPVSLIDGDRSSNYPSQEFVSQFKTETHQILFLNSSNFKDNKLDLQNAQFITKEKFDSLSKGKLIDDDLVMTVRGSIGNIIRFNFKDKTGFINAQMLIIRNVKYNNVLSTNFLYTVLCSDVYKKRILRLSSGSAQPQLPVKDLKSLDILLPSLPEQEKIAAVLSAADEEISTLEKQLAAYKQQKLGLMQQLLTGSIRI